MSTLGRLLEVQALDLDADGLRRKRSTLPERAALASNEADRAALERERAAVQTQNDELARAERELGSEVESIASKARDVESNLYSGSVTVPKELDGLQQELGLLKAKLEEAEGREFALLEQLEQVEAQLSAAETRRQELETGADGFRASIAAAEATIDGEIAGLEASAGELRAGLPAPVLAAYDRLRGDARLGGRAAVGFASKSCAGCQLDLPALVYSRILEEPEDALVTCVHCYRLLIR